MRSCRSAGRPNDDWRAIMHDPDRASARAKSGAGLNLKIDAAWDANRKLYGAQKAWPVSRRGDEDVPRCTVERLMRHLGIRGVIRGKKVITTSPDKSLHYKRSRRIVCVTLERQRVQHVPPLPPRLKPLIAAPLARP